MSHTDLTKNHSIVDYEVQQSRLILQETTGQEINSFSYPYGYHDDFVTGEVRAFGYSTAVGLGLNWEHYQDALYDLSRIEVQGSYSLYTFAQLLPWSGN